MIKVNEVIDEKQKNLTDGKWIISVWNEDIPEVLMFDDFDCFAKSKSYDNIEHYLMSAIGISSEDLYLFKA